MGSDARALLEQMKGRLERGAFAALGVPEGASAQAARSAFLQLTKTYHPAKFAREAPEVVRQANEVFLALRAAYESITQPRKPAQSRATPAGGVPIVTARMTPAGGVPITTARMAPAGGVPTTTARMTPSGGVPTTAARSGSPSGRDPAPPPSARSTARLPQRDPAGAPVVRSAGTPPNPIVTIKPAAASTAPRPAPQPRPAAVIRPGAPARPPAGGTSATATPSRPTAPGGIPISPQPAAPAGPLQPARPPSAALPTLSPGVVPGSEEADLEIATHFLRKRQWGEARKVLQGLAARVPAEKKYRALLGYARGREAQDEGRHEEARGEFTRALQLDPELGIAKAALAQVAPAPTEEPERPSGGLLSRLFKK